MPLAADSQPITSNDPFIKVPSLRALGFRVPRLNVQSLRRPLQLMAGLLIAPLVLVFALVFFVATLADFAWFRLQDLRHGRPEPKRLWEF